jgi:hypothetical protein
MPEVEKITTDMDENSPLRADAVSHPLIIYV